MAGVPCSSPCRKLPMSALEKNLRAFECWSRYPARAQHPLLWCPAADGPFPPSQTAFQMCPVPAAVTPDVVRIDDFKERSGFKRPGGPAAPKRQASRCGSILRQRPPCPVPVARACQLSREPFFYPWCLVLACGHASRGPGWCMPLLGISTNPAPVRVLARAARFPSPCCCQPGHVLSRQRAPPAAAPVVNVCDRYPCFAVPTATRSATRTNPHRSGPGTGQRNPVWAVDCPPWARIPCAASVRLVTEIPGDRDSDDARRVGSEHESEESAYGGPSRGKKTKSNGRGCATCSRTSRTARCACGRTSCGLQPWTSSRRYAPAPSVCVFP